MRLDLFFAAIRVPLDYALLILAGTSAWFLRFSDSVTEIRSVTFGLTFEEFFSTLLLVALLWVIIFAFTGLYTIGGNKKFSDELKKTIIGCFAGLAVVTLIIFFRRELFDSRFLVVAATALGILYVLIGRLLLRIIKIILFKNNIGNRRIILIGDTDAADSIVAAMKNTPGFGYKIVKHVPEMNSKNLKELTTLIRRKNVEEVLFIKSKVSEKESEMVLVFCSEHHLTLKFAPDVFSSYQRATGIDTIAGIPIVELKRTRLEGWGKIIKRLADIFFGLLLLIISLPITILATLIIAFETGAPIVFKNRRVGESGKEFETLKFRSMHQKFSIGTQFKNQKEAMDFEKTLIKKQNSKKGPIYKIKDDPRITKFGGFIRRWSIDELPQFINVIRGQMSLVGPRPHQPREVEKYELHHKKVHTIKPGITGLAQISGRSDLTFEEENRLDVFYIENWSLLMDIAILIKTPWAVLRRRKVL